MVLLASVPSVSSSHLTRTGWTGTSGGKDGRGEEKWHMSGESINYWAYGAQTAMNTHTVAFLRCRSLLPSETIGVRTGLEQKQWQWQQQPKSAQLTPTKILFFCCTLAVLAVFSVFCIALEHSLSPSLSGLSFSALCVCMFVSCASPQHSISISISSTVVACLLFIICLRRQSSLFWVAFEAKNEKEEKVVVAAVVVVAMVNTIFSHAVKLIYYKWKEKGLLLLLLVVQLQLKFGERRRNLVLNVATLWNLTKTCVFSGTRVLPVLVGGWWW